MVNRSGPSLQAFVEVIRTHLNSDGAVVKCASSAMKNVTYDKEGTARADAAGAVKVLNRAIELFCGRHAKATAKACGPLGNMCVDIGEVKAQLAQLGALNQLCKALHR